MFIYGLNPVAEALGARKVSKLVHLRGGGQRVDKIVARARELRIPVDAVDRRLLDKMTRGGVHQGVAAEVAALAAYTLEELVHGAEGPALLVMLDGVEDPQNVGAILRSVDGAGATGVVRQARHSARLDGAAAKASAGAVTHVRIATVVNLSRALQELKEMGVWTVGLDAAGSESYDDVDYTVPTALVVGAEGKGLRRLVRETCDRVVAIPLSGSVASLNVAASASVALFEAARQRRRAAQAAIQGPAEPSGG